MVELIFRHTVLQDCIQREITQRFAYSSFILTWLPMRVRSDRLNAPQIHVFITSTVMLDTKLMETQIQILNNEALNKDVYT
jgi:hypothetical protein